MLLYEGDHRPVPGAVLHTCALPGPPCGPGAPLRAAGAVTSIAPLGSAAPQATPTAATSHRRRLPDRWLLGTAGSEVLQVSWDSKGTRLLPTRLHEAHRSAISAVAFPSDLSKVVAVACFEEVRLWRLDPLQHATKRVLVPGVQALSVAFNPVRNTAVQRRPTH